MTIYKCSIANSQDNVDSIVQKERTLKERNELFGNKARDRTRFMKNSRFFIQQLKSVQNFQLTLPLDF